MHHCVELIPLSPKPKKIVYEVKPIIACTIFENWTQMCVIPCFHCPAFGFTQLWALA